MTKCDGCAGHSFDEENLHVALSAKHCRILSSYLLNMGMGESVVREMLIADIRGLLDLGAKQKAADLRVVLECFLSDYPETRPAKSSWERMDRGFLV